MLYGKARADPIRRTVRSPRMVGTVQDVTERRELEREHRIAETLQQALLPERLPQLVGISLAARYVPAEEGSAAGGDWYDVIELPDGGVALVIGDVAGHGTEAASVMGQVRMAVRAFSLEGHAPSVVVGRVHDLLRSLYEGEQMVTMLYLVVDPTTWEATMVNAGHPPPLLLDADGGATYLETPTGLPVGLELDPPVRGVDRAACDRERRSCCTRTASSTAETSRSRKGSNGSARRPRTRWGWTSIDLCGVLLETLVPADASDDVAILAARLDPVEERLSLHIPADPARLRLRPAEPRSVALRSRRAEAGRGRHHPREFGGVRELDRARLWSRRGIGRHRGGGRRGERSRSSFETPAGGGRLATATGVEGCRS